MDGLYIYIYIYIYLIHLSFTTKAYVLSGTCHTRMINRNHKEGGYEVMCVFMRLLLLLLLFLLYTLWRSNFLHFKIFTSK